MPPEADPLPIAPTCLFCGEPERGDLFEAWSSHEFMLECCCEGTHETVTRQMADDPAWARTLLQQIGVEEITGYGLRRLADDGCCGILLDRRLELRAVSFATAWTFIGRHHSHCSAPAGWRFGKDCWNGGTMISVGNPVARGLCKRSVLEVNRLCIRRDIPQALAWNAASKPYGRRTREADSLPVDIALLPVPGESLRLRPPAQQRRVAPIALCARDTPRQCWNWSKPGRARSVPQDQESALQNRCNRSGAAPRSNQPANRRSGKPFTPKPWIANSDPRSTPSPGKRGSGGFAIEVAYRMSRLGPPNITLVTFFTGISIVRSTLPSGRYRTIRPA